MAVVMPAPLEPTNPNICPSTTVKDRSSRATKVAVAAGQPLQVHHVVLLTRYSPQCQGLDWHLSSGPGRRRPARGGSWHPPRSHMSHGSKACPHASLVGRRLVPPTAHRPRPGRPLADEGQWDSMPQTCERPSLSSRPWYRLKAAPSARGFRSHGSIVQTAAPGRVKRTRVQAVPGAPVRQRAAGSPCRRVLRVGNGPGRYQ